MGFIQNVRIQNRLFFGFGMVLSLIIALTVLGINEVSQIDSKLTVINDLNSVKQRYAINFRGSVHDRSIAVRDLVLLDDADELQRTNQEIRDLTEMYADSARRMDQIFAVPENVDAAERRILDSIQEIEQETLPQIEAIVETVAAGDLDEAKAILIEQARPNFVTWLARINQFIDLEEEKNNSLTTETRTIAADFRSQTILFTSIALVISVLVAAWAVLGVRPLKNLSDIVLQLASGKLDVDVPNADARDEVGMISGAVKVFRDNAVEAKRLGAEAAEREEQERIDKEARAEQRAREEQERKAAREAAETAAREQRRTEMLALADQFETSVMGLVEELSAASNDMQQVADHVASALDTTVSDSDKVDASASEAHANARQVAESASELSRSVRSVSQQTLQSASVANDAVDHTRRANEDISQLADAAKSIGDVVNLITEIAEQTNLLALNATIEAARAGDAGRGFAVVANEVKSLASQTAGATQKIGEQVNDMQNATQKAVAAVEQIQAQISEIGKNAEEIATAVEQQDVATESIASNIAMVSQGTEEVTGTIKGVNSSARESGKEAQTVVEAASSLNDKAVVLRRSVQEFLENVRSE